MKNKKIILAGSLFILAILILTIFSINRGSGLEEVDNEHVEVEEESELQDLEVQGFKRVAAWSGGDLFSVEENGLDLILKYNKDHSFKIPVDWYVRDEDVVTLQDRDQICRINIEEKSNEDQFLEMTSFLKERGGSQEEDGVRVELIEIRGSQVLITEDDLNIAGEIIINDKVLSIFSRDQEGKDCKQQFKSFLKI